MHEPPRRRSIAALGDVLDPECFGGSPSQFYNAAKERGFAHDAWRVDLRRLRADRWRWNAGRLLSGRRPGGFQFSSAGRRAALERSDPSLLSTDVISFHQHVPPFGDVENAGGTLNFYIDATYRQLLADYGFERSLPKAVIREALEYERDAFRSARWIVASQTWTLRSLTEDYGVPPEKCAAILPAPNYAGYPGVRPDAEGIAGKDRPFVIGFIGKDWRRKGLKIAVEVAGILRRIGWKVRIQAIGFPPNDCPFRDQVECLGFIDKRTQFGPFLHGCDIGCLFSSAEAAGIAALEFLGVGVPVAGFTVNGLSDLLPTEAGFRFPATTTPDDIASVFNEYLRDGARHEVLRSNAIDFAALLTWRRCVDEFEELWRTGSVANPFRLWKGK
jgi:glycosyltransferase involved in cell wall biosynthesis